MRYINYMQENSASRRITRSVYFVIQTQAVLLSAKVGPSSSPSSRIQAVMVGAYSEHVSTTVVQGVCT